MANVKISELSASVALTGAEIVPIVQSSTTVRTTVQDIIDLTPSANTSSLLITASANLNTITFTKGDGSPFNVVVNTGSVNLSGYTTTSSFNSFTSSVVTTSSFNAFTSSVVTTSSFNAFTSSVVTTSSFNSFTSSYNTGSFTGSFTGRFIGAGGSNTQIQFNSGSAFSGSTTFRFNYASQSLEQGVGIKGIGDYSHAEGENTIASGSYSHAEGIQTQAIGPHSHAEGASTKAIGSASHAEGANTEAIGHYSHAEGNSTIAIADFSHTEGYFTVACGSYQTVVGQYNATSTAQSAFIVGNGVSELFRSNLLVADPTTDTVTVRRSLQLIEATFNITQQIPGAPLTGSMYLDVAQNRLYIYNGTTWKYASLT